MRSQTQEDLEKEVYSPMEPLDFAGDTKLRIYECNPEMATLRWKRHFPKVIATPILIADLYKMLFTDYTGFIWVTLPLFPLIVLAAFQRNLQQNAEGQIYEMNLLKNGM